MLILDHITDPGNLGTLLRTAAGLDWNYVYIGPNSVDPFNDKALRAAKGSTFKIPIIYKEKHENLLNKLKENSWEIFVADVKKGKEVNKMFEQLTASNHSNQWNGVALVLGSESSGISTAFDKIEKRIFLPMSSKIESLNVSAAGAILMEKFQYILNKESLQYFIVTIFRTILVRTIIGNVRLLFRYR